MVTTIPTLDLEAGDGNVALAFVNSLPNPLDATSDLIATPAALEEWLTRAVQAAPSRVGAPSGHWTAPSGHWTTPSGNSTAPSGNSTTPSGRSTTPPERSTTLPELKPTPPERRMLLNEAHRLRPALRELFEAVSGGRAVSRQTLHVLNRAQEFGRWTSRLVDDAEGLHMLTHLVDDTPLSVLSSIARAAAEIATTVKPDRLRECAAADCARWFVDSSKGGRRRWCSMASCGNRSKAARFRARHAAD